MRLPRIFSVFSLVLLFIVPCWSADESDFSYFIFQDLADWEDESYAERLPLVRQTWEVLEKEAMDSQAEFEAQLSGDVKERRWALTLRTHEYAVRALQMAKEMVRNVNPHE